MARAGKGVVLRALHGRLRLALVAAREKSNRRGMDRHTE